MRDPKQRAEDVAFLKNQKTDHTSKMSPSIDKSFSDRQDRKIKRQSYNSQFQNLSINQTPQEPIYYESPEKNQRPENDTNFNLPPQRRVPTRKTLDLSSDPEFLAT